MVPRPVALASALLPPALALGLRLAVVCRLCLFRLGTAEAEERCDATGARFRLCFSLNGFGLRRRRGLARLFDVARHRRTFARCRVVTADRGPIRCVERIRRRREVAYRRRASVLAVAALLLPTLEIVAVTTAAAAPAAPTAAPALLAVTVTFADGGLLSVLGLFTVTGVVAVVAIVVGSFAKVFRWRHF